MIYIEGPITNPYKINKFSITYSYREQDGEKYQEIHFYDTEIEFIWKVECFDDQYKLYGRYIQDCNFEKNPNGMYVLPKDNNTFELKIKDSLFEVTIGKRPIITLK